MHLLRSAILFTTVFTTAVGLASAVHAADVSAPASDWTGLYVGFGAGGGFAFSDMSAAGAGAYEDTAQNSQDWEDLNTANFKGDFQCDASLCDGATSVFSALDGDSGTAGFLGRAELGADYQLDRIVAGVNASFTVGDRSMSSSGAGGGGGTYTDSDGVDVDGGGAAAIDSELKLGNSWSIGARLGYLVTDSLLVFATGGYTQASAKLDAEFEGAGAAGANELSGISGAYNISTSQDEWLSGYYVGGGLETLLTDQFSLKVEYRYADYGSIETSSDASDLKCNPDCFGWATGVEAEADVTDHSLMATVSFRM